MRTPVTSRLAKTGMLAAALAVAGCSDAPEKPVEAAIETPEPDASTDSIAEGFYKVASARTTLYAAKNGELRPILHLDQGKCLRVTDGNKGHDAARVSVEGMDGGYVRKADLVPAPQECGGRESNEAKGITLESRAIFLYETPESKTPVAQIIKGQCVVVLGARAAEDWTKVAVNTPLGRKEGWGYTMHMNSRNRCVP